MTRAHSAGLSSGKPESHVGVISVPDKRLDRLTSLFQPRKTVHAAIEYVDTPGSIIDLVRGGSQSAMLREVQALTQVVKAFDNTMEIAPGLERDIENVELELILSDLAAAEKRIERLQKDVKKQKNAALEQELRMLELCRGTLEKQKPLRELPLDAEQERIIRGFTFLSLKPLLYVLNLGERDAARTDLVDAFAATAGLERRPRTAVTAVCGKVEEELAELSDEEAREFMGSFGLKDSAIARVIRSSYELLGLISFFTVGEDECRAWTIRSGATAWDAAGEIHSDIQRGFIRAEVVTYDDLIAAASLAEARNRGRLRLEGKDYVVKDGEVVHFRHSG
jgi:ribosome-binding ATPase